MKKIFISFFLMLSLLIVPANASVAPGWHKHSEVEPNIYSYEYVFSDGTFATGWQFINGYWYYFADESYSSIAGMFTYNSNANCWVGGTESEEINGQYYYFNTDNQLLVNTDIMLGSGHFKYHLDENGHIV